MRSPRLTVSSWVSLPAVLALAASLTATPAFAQVDSPAPDTKPGLPSNAKVDTSFRAESASPKAQSKAEAQDTVAANGLVAAYGMDSTTGTVVADSSGLNNNGTALDTAWVNGKYGRGLSFNGGTSLVSIADAPSLRLTNTLTLSAWVRPSSVDGWRTVLSKDFDSGDGASFMLYGSNSTAPSGWMVVDYTSYEADGTSALPVNTWSHLATTYDGTTARLYVNGTQVGQVPVTGNVDMDDGNLLIGGNIIWGEYFAGLIDEVRVYNRAQSAQEIQTDMNTAVPAPPPTQTTVSLPLLSDTYTATYTDSQPAHTALWAGGFTADGVMEFERTYLKFDTAQLAGKTIVDAQLELFNSSSGGCASPGQSLKAQQVTAAWDQNTLTWANQPAATATGEASAGDPAGCGTVNVPWNWTVKSIAESWAGGTANHGLVVRAAIENPAGQSYDRAFHSSERTGTGVRPPKLTVTYTESAPAEQQAKRSASPVPVPKAKSGDSAPKPERSSGSSSRNLR
ncbi:LamG-like jellyroll fold domain-containing protein [Nonomuraea sp. NPDC050404]|uniref:LamG-like jellyroll fold domain-containing protein n=1 Tax=Nonomuraea sp. NPDC050404 TaxID=3155783 RepID=UPI0033CA9A91